MRRQRRAIAKGDHPSASFRHWDELAVAPSPLVWEEVTPGVAPKAAAALQARASAARVAAVHCDSVLVVPAEAQLGAALAGAGCSAAAAGHSAAAERQPDGSVAPAVSGAAALTAAQRAGSAAAGHSAAAELQPDGSVAPAVPGAAVLMEAQKAGSAAAAHSAAAELQPDGSVVRAVPGAAALEAQKDVALLVGAALAPELRALGCLVPPLAACPGVAP